MTRIGTKIHDILLEGLVSPYRNCIYRYEGSDILRISHHTHDDTTRIVTTGVYIDRTPETHLTLVEREECLRSIGNSRSSHEDIFIRRYDGRRVRSTRENCTRGLVQRIVSTLRSAGHIRIDIRVFITRITTPCPFRITLNILRSYRHRKIIRVRYLFRWTNAEAERTIFRQFAAPDTCFVLTQRTNIYQIKLIGLKCDIIVLLQSAD